MGEHSVPLSKVPHERLTSRCACKKNVVVGNRSPRWLEAEDMGYRTFFIELMCSGSVMGTLDNAFFAQDLPNVVVYNGK